MHSSRKYDDIEYYDDIDSRRISTRLVHLDVYAAYLDQPEDIEKDALEAMT